MTMKIRVLDYQDRVLPAARRKQLIHDRLDLLKDWFSTILDLYPVDLTSSFYSHVYLKGFFLNFKWLKSRAQAFFSGGLPWRQSHFKTKMY